MLAHRLARDAEDRADHAQYIASWLTLLKSDPKAIFITAAKASQAMAWLKAKQVPSRGRHRAPSDRR